MKSDFRGNLEPKIQNAVNMASFCAAIITLFLIIILGYFRRKAFDRVTLRFQGSIALIDIAKHLNLFSLTQPYGILCMLVGFSRFFVDHMYVFVNVLIALNIQLVYTSNILPKPIYEILYITLASTTAFVIDLIPLVFNAYGKNDSGHCFLKQGLANRFYYKISLVYVTLFPGLVYCVLVFFWVTISLYRKKTYLDDKFPSKNITIFNETVNGREFITKLYFRLSLYPISAVVSFLPYLISNVYSDVYGGTPDWMYFTVRICNRLAGIMNLISLLIDPHFQLTIKNIYKNGLANQALTSPDSTMNELSDLKRDEEYLIRFPGEKNIHFEDYIRFL